MRFSERMHKKRIKCDLQVDSMDADLRNSLWNILWDFVISDIQEWHDINVDSSWHDFVTILWDEFFKQRIDEIPWDSAYKVQQFAKTWLLQAEWYEVYDLLEFIAKARGPFDRNKFKSSCNSVLERELSGYRFVGNEIAPITNKVEIGQIEESLEITKKHSFNGVRVHLETALEKLSDRKTPDYRNSIKESISAIESLCIVISRDSKASLGQALKLIKEKVSLHPALEKGFSSIYGYTSDANGIRHAMIDESSCEFDDAKYMLVSCSAFVHYLIMKANKAGLIE